MPSRDPHADLGPYWAEVARRPLLTPASERDLGARARAGDRAALDRLVEGNLRLVVRCARPLRGRGLDLADLIQLGNLGLIRAAAKYDPSRGIRYATMAVPWVRSAMIRGVREQGSTVRVPDYLHELIRREADHPRPGRASPRVAASMALGRAALARARRSPADVAARAGRAPTPLDVLIAAEAGDPAEVAAARVEALLARLDRRSADVIRRRLGLGGRRPETLAEIAASWGITGSRVQQVEARALERLGAAGSAARAGVA